MYVCTCINTCIWEWTKKGPKSTQCLTVAAVEVAVVPCTVLWGVPVCTAVAVPNVVVCAVPPRTIWGCREYKHKIILHQNPFSWTIPAKLRQRAAAHLSQPLSAAVPAVPSAAVEGKTQQMAQHTVLPAPKPPRLMKGHTIFGYWIKWQSNTRNMSSYTVASQLK